MLINIILINICKFQLGGMNEILVLFMTTEWSGRNRNCLSTYWCLMSQLRVTFNCSTRSESEVCNLWRWTACPLSPEIYTVQGRIKRWSNCLNYFTSFQSGVLRTPLLSPGKFVIKKMCLIKNSTQQFFTKFWQWSKPPWNHPWCKD